MQEKYAWIRSCEEKIMSNSDQNVHHEAEPEQPKIDERLSKLSLIARNVTLRLSSPTNTKHGKISRKFTGKESRTDINLVEKSKGEVANLKTLSLNKIKHGDMRSTSAHSSNINQDAQAMENRNNCSQISMRSEKYTHSPPKARTCTLKSSSLTDTSNKGNVLPVNCKQSQKQKVEKGENLSESYVCAKQVGKVTHNCEEPPNSGTISASCLTGQFEIAEKVSPKRLDEVQHHNSCKRMPSRKITGQTSSVKPRIAFGPIQRRKSMKLGERSLVRKKSFLKKGDGLAAKGRYLTKRIKADDTGERKMTSTSEEKYKDNNSIRRFPRMPGRKDNTNSTFLLTRNRKLLNKAINPVLDGNKSANSFPRSRRQWNESSVQVIFVCILYIELNIKLYN